MAKVTDILPEIYGEEMLNVQSIIERMDDEKARSFANAYRARRKDPNIILITPLLGFAGFAGIQRFLIGDILLGLIYLFTAGLCFIGTIVDLVNHQKLAADANKKVALEIASVIS
ncbi:MAG TPA: TM2 domain-containing protein [Cyclobacteriaceae bacterium]|nr:TM2 domain-containing protein [Cyclobacteriaceae bacterium]